MNCQECRGACCESINLDIVFVPLDKDAARWLSLHGTEQEDGQLSFECRCRMLTDQGRCSIWEDRPMTCELFVAGSQKCLDTVRQRRTLADFQRIREDGDPQI